MILGHIDLPQELPQELLPGIIAIFLTSSTQELFKLKGGEHVSAERLPKFVPKSDILADWYARAAVSDFLPIKSSIQVIYPAAIYAIGISQRRDSCTF